MTPLWRELRSILTVGSLTAGVALAFPLSALDFKPRTVPAEAEASAAFVHLTPEEEDLILLAAKATWQDETSAMQRMRVRWSLGDLPEEESPRLLEVSVRQPIAEPEPIAYVPRGFSPSSAAPAPAHLAAEPETKPAPAFSRQELLDLN